MKKETITGLEEKYEALLVYLFPLLGFIFSFMKEKKVSENVKFYYNQSGAIFIIDMALSIISGASLFIFEGIINYISFVVGMLLFVFIVIAIVKAFNDEKYEIPVISELAKSIWK